MYQTPTVDQGDQYFQTHLEAATWAAATPETKAGALTTAALEINSLPLSPYANGTRVVNAIFEQAVFRLKRDVKREELQAQGVQQVQISGGVTEYYGVQMYGIALAPRAKLLLTGCFGVGVIR